MKHKLIIAAIIFSGLALSACSGLLGVPVVPII